MKRIQIALSVALLLIGVALAPAQDSAAMTRNPDGSWTATTKKGGKVVRQREYDKDRRLVKDTTFDENERPRVSTTYVWNEQEKRSEKSETNAVNEDGSPNMKTVYGPNEVIQEQIAYYENGKSTRKVYVRGKAVRMEYYEGDKLVRTKKLGS